MISVNTSEKYIPARKTLFKLLDNVGTGTDELKLLMNKF